MRNNEIKNEINAITKWKEKIKQNDLRYETNIYIYIYLWSWVQIPLRSTCYSYF